MYRADELRVTRHRRFAANDAELLAVQSQWERALRLAVRDLPAIRFEANEEAKTGS